MSNTPQTIEEILITLQAMAQSPETSAYKARERAKQAIKEAILTEVIGPTHEESGVRVKGITDISTSHDTTIDEIRQRLDAWLGLEDTSNEWCTTMTIKEAEEKLTEARILADEAEKAAREAQSYAIQTLAIAVSHLLANIR